jgi:hypothetical protein
MRRAATQIACRASWDVSAKPQLLGTAADDTELPTDFLASTRVVVAKASTHCGKEEVVHWMGADLLGGVAILTVRISVEKADELARRLGERTLLCREQRCLRITRVGRQDQLEAFRSGVDPVRLELESRA